MKRVLSLLGMMMLFIVMGCTNLSTDKSNQYKQSVETEETEEGLNKAMEKENAVFNSVPVFDLSAEDVYKKLNTTKNMRASIKEDKSTAQFVNENMITTVYNHHDEKIDQIFIQISSAKFYKNEKHFHIVKDNFKEIFKVLNTEYNEKNLLKILKVDVKKERKNKVDSYPEDIKLFPYNRLWIGVEAIYNTNNEPEPNQLKVIIYPEKPDL